jgi:hypothetical protein
LIRFRDGEAGADHRVLFGAGAILDVGGSDEGAVGQEFEAGVAAVAAFVAVEQLDFIFAIVAAEDVFVTTHPGDEVRFSRAGAAHVAEDDDEAAIGQIDVFVAVAMQAGR